MMKTNCECCTYYVYDEDYECYSCEVNSDEDDMSRFLSDSMEACHYFQLDDEYKVVRKQM